MICMCARLNDKIIIRLNGANNKLLWKSDMELQFLLCTELYQKFHCHGHCLVQRVHGSSLYPLRDSCAGMFEAQSLQQPADVRIELSTHRTEQGQTRLQFPAHTFKLS